MAAFSLSPHDCRDGVCAIEIEYPVTPLVSPGIRLPARLLLRRGPLHRSRVTKEVRRSAVFETGKFVGASSDTVSAVGKPQAAARARRTFRIPLAVRLFSLFGVVFLAGVTGIMIVFAAYAFTTQWMLGLFMTACAGIIGALAGYTWRDLRGKWGLRIVLDTDAVTLDLPAGRSLIHRPPSQHLTIYYADIAAIETRFEAYGSLGMEIMQRAYVLQRKRGELIFLFEERALATGMESSMFADVIKDLVARAGIAMRELGTVGVKAACSECGELTPQAGPRRRNHVSAQLSCGAMRLQLVRPRFRSLSL